MRPETIRGVVAVAASIACLWVAPGAAAETITVDVGDDVTDPNDGDCTLREAVTAASTNTASGGAADECEAGEDGPAERDVVDFSVGAAGSSQVIGLSGAALPVIDDQVEIDGRNGAASGPRIEVNGTAVVGASAVGIFLTTGSEGSEVHDIAVNDFSGDGVNLFSGSNTIERVISGTNLAGTSSTLGNGAFGIDVVGDSNQLVQVLSSANGSYGVNVDFRADGTTITGSRIGTTLDGTGDLGNTGYGVFVGASNLEAADNTTIGGTAGLTPGGTCTGDCNLISGNSIDGVFALGADEFGVTGLVVRGNHIGANLAGAAAIANSRGGVNVAGNVQATLIRDNVISGNTDDGVVVGAWTSPTTQIAPSDTAIEGNRIGVTSGGGGALANGERGVLVVSDTSSGFDPVTGTVIGGSDGLTAGGPCTGDCNVISGNTDFGVSAFGAVDGTQVLGNHIGVSSGGESDVGNGQAGISVGEAGGNVVGAPGAGNVVSGNTGSGIQLTDAAPGNEVQANLIGAGAGGASAIGNDGAGVSVLTGSQGALVGGTGAGEGNVIAGNGDAGIEVGGGGGAATGNAFLGNSIHDNAGLGIDLGETLGGADGPTPNDGPGDPDDGGNDLQNFPELTAAVAGGSTFVAGRLETAASRSYRVEVFASPSGDEGETFLGAFEVATGGAGAVSFAESVAGTADPGDVITATATELAGNGDALSTSELSAAVAEGCDNTPTEGADTVTGTGADEVLCGAGGADVIRPGGGHDVIVAGTGSDRLDLDDATARVDVDLGAGTGSTGPDDLLLDDVEDVIGSRFADDLRGDGAGNELEGGDGKDTVLGGDGADIARGGDGKDTLKGQAGADTVKGQDSRDTLVGGDGGDTLKGGRGRKDDLEGGQGRDSLNGGGDKKDVCDGGPDRDKRSAPGCETKRSLP